MTRETIEQEVPTTKTETETFIICDDCGLECEDEYETHGDYHIHPNCELGIRTAVEDAWYDAWWVRPTACFYAVSNFLIAVTMAVMGAWFWAYGFGAMAIIAAVIFSMTIDGGVTYHTPGRW